MSNGKWLAALSKHAQAALKNCALEERWPIFDSYTNDVNALSVQALKNKKEWLTESDVYNIFRKVVLKHIDATFPAGEKTQGKLQDLFEKEVLNTAAEEIVNFIDSIPRNYIFYFPLPGLQDSVTEDVVFSEELSIRVLKEDNPLVSKNNLIAIFDPRKLSRGSYLEVKASGYAGTSIEDSASAEAFGKLKQVVHLGNIRAIFKLRSIPFGFGISGLGGHHAPNLNVFVVDSEFPHETQSNFLLPINTSRHIDRIAINDESSSYKNFVTTNKMGITDYLIGAFSAVTVLTSSKVEGAESVRTAIEWAFDAHANDNDTIAFLQVCIGLEAIFGDAVSTESLAATLADRCAYFISTNISGRNAVRQNFRELYVRRSKLVHGRRNKISDEDRFYLTWGKHALDYSIWKEISFLKSET